MLATDEIQPSIRPDHLQVERVRLAALCEYARCWREIQQIYPGITLRAALAAVRADRGDTWRGLDEIAISEN